MYNHTEVDENDLLKLNQKKIWWLKTFLLSFISGNKENVYMLLCINAVVAYA